MWQDMTGNDYETVPGGILHKPTGVMIEYRAAAQWTLRDTPYVVRSTRAIPGAIPYVAEFDIDSLSSDVHAMRLGQSCEEAQNQERFLRSYGRLGTLRSVRTLSGSIPWDKQLIDVIAILYFIYRDLAGFARGQPACPDKLEVVARQVPRALRQTVINPFASSVPRP